MKHIRNFRNFPINEMQDWAMMPVDVNKGLGDALNNFYSECVDFITEIKKYIGNKFSEYKEMLTKIYSEMKKLSYKQLSSLYNDLKSFTGSTDKKIIYSKVEAVVKDEFRKAGMIKEDKSDTESVVKKAMNRILRETEPSSFYGYWVYLVCSFISLFSAAVIGGSVGISLVVMVIVGGIYLIFSALATADQDSPESSRICTNCGFKIKVKTNLCIACGKFIGNNT